MSAHAPLRVSVVSLGCPKALVDTEKMLALLAEAGCLVGADESQADVILVNTCAFIAPAERESMRAVRRAVAAKRPGGVRRVVVAGCLPQRRAEQLLRDIPGIDAVVGVFNRDQIVQAVTGLDASAGCAFYRVDPAGAGPGDDRGRLRLTPRHTAYLRLSEGCSQRCSYCTIPTIRGPLRSKSMAQVLQEAAELVGDGAIELNLIAQDTTAYGRDLGDGTNLAELLRRLDGLDGLRWIRLMYAHPASMTDPVMDALAECPRVVKYLDLPLQHVNDGILGLMRRRYDRAAVERLIGALRSRMPRLALRTSLIVGFPGEGDAEYDELLEFVQATRFDALGVFPYWPEEGTPAARLPGAVPEKVKRRRRDRLMRLQQQIALAANAARVGAAIDVLVEGKGLGGRCVGRHPGQAPETDGVCLLTAGTAPGRIIPARVVGCQGYDLLVEPVAP